MSPALCQNCLWFGTVPGPFGLVRSEPCPNCGADNEEPASAEGYGFDNGLCDCGDCITEVLRRRDLRALGATQRAAALALFDLGGEAGGA